jgi:hypothetical protein
VIVAMVNEGWSYGELMEMDCEELAFWVEAQAERNKRLAEAARDRR